MEENSKQRSGWIVFSMFSVIVSVVGAGFVYAGFEIVSLLQSVGLESKAYADQINGYRTGTIAYGVFTVLLIYLSIEAGSRVMTKDMVLENYRLQDELAMAKSKNDDLSVQIKGLENRIRIKNEELAKDKVRFEKSEIFDAATGLYNEEYLHSILPAEINRAKRDKKPLVLTLVDVNDLEQYKSRFGEEQIGKIIDVMAKQIKLCAKRAGDFSFRLDDDVFAILFSGLSVENTKRFMSFVQESILTEAASDKSTEGIGQLGLTIAATMAYSDTLSEAEVFIAQARRTLREARRANPCRRIFRRILDRGVG